MNPCRFFPVGISFAIYHFFTIFALPLPRPFPGKWNSAKTGVLYRAFYRFQGSRYPNAAHYWPFNATTKGKTLIDVRGNCKTETYNMVRITYAEQLGPVVSLDGKDDWIFMNGIRSKCINDPTLCSRGLTMAFWIKYHAGQFILSGGRYTDQQQGPGFRFVCSNCANTGDKPNSNTAKQKAKRFILNLSTQTQDWKLNLDFLPKAWFHFAFTWHLDHGLKVYKNGRLVVKDTKPEKVKYRPLSPRYDIITLGRPNSLSKLHNHGKFEIGHFVIWPYELSAYEVEVAFLTVLAKTTKSLICCHFKKADPCLDNPCYDGASCRSIDEKFQCICPDISPGLCPKSNTGQACIDKSETCAMYAKQEGYCENNRKSMSLMCARTCKFCTAGIPNVDGQEGRNSTANMSRSTFIIVLVTGIGGFVVLAIIIIYMLVKFLRRMKGEFVPDKIYPNEQKSNSGSDQLIPQFIDPSTPRITDVPKKTVRTGGASNGSAGGGGGGSGGSGGGSKKSKKPMGVKVTYKPPKWD